MIDRIRKAWDEESGFTLIELLVVVIIIGILAAIAIPVFLNQRESAWRSSVESDLRNAAAQFETYYTSESGYPPANTGVTGPTTATLGSSDIEITVSDSVTLAWEEPTQTYCIQGSHASIDSGSVILYYDSSAGGLTETAC